MCAFWLKIAYLLHLASNTHTHVNCLTPVAFEQTLHEGVLKDGTFAAFWPQKRADSTLATNDKNCVHAVLLRVLYMSVFHANFVCISAEDGTIVAFRPQVIPAGVHITQNCACSCAEDAKLASFSVLNPHASVYITSSLWCFTRFTRAGLLRIAGLSPAGK